MTLNPAVGFVARHTTPHEREKNLLGEDRPAQPFEVGAHHRGPDLEPLDDVGQPRQHEVDDDRRIRTDHPLDRGVARSEEHTSELQSQSNLACRLLPAYTKNATSCRSCT